MIAYPLSVGSVQTRVLEMGEGANTVFFLHGVGARADRWAKNIPFVAARGFRAVAIDLPGHGFADKGDIIEYSVPSLARFVIAALEALEIDRPLLVGTSLGGHISAYLSAKLDQDVAGLVLVGPTGLVEIGPQAGKAIRDSIIDTSREAVERKLRFVFHDLGMASDELIREEFAINRSRGADRSFEKLGAYFASHIDDDVVGPALGELAGKVPVTLVWGAEDRVVPASLGQQVSRNFDIEPAVVIESAGHAPYFERPDAFNRVLETCLTRSFDPPG